MTPAELAAIRDRSNANPVPTGSVAAWICDADRDRRDLLAEVDSLTIASRAAESTYMTMADNLNRQDDEIDRLTTENERYRAFIKELIFTFGYGSSGPEMDDTLWKARAALNPEEEP